MTTPAVSIIIPTRNRSHLLLERFRILEKNTPEIARRIAEVIVVIDSDDILSAGVINSNFPNFTKVISEPLELPCNKWNQAAKLCTSSVYFVTISDDSIPHPNWLTNALALASRGFIGLPDGVTGKRNETFTPLYMASREWLKRYHGGVLVIPHYKSWFADMETAQRAKRTHTYIVGANSVVEQLHSGFNTAPDDAIYQLGASRRIDDYKMYLKRQALGFPDDFESVL